MRSIWVRRGSWLLWLTVLVHSAPAVPQASEPNPRSTIRVTGESLVTVRPDQAQLELGVISQADTAASAASQNAQRLDSVVAELKRLVGPSGEVRTVGYSVSPNYRYPKEGGKPTIVSYTVSNVVLARTGDLAQVGKILDAATQSGANTIQRLQFTLRNDRAAQSEALKLAAETARGKAEAIAAALGVRIVRVVGVEESGAPPRPIMERTFAMGRAEAAAPTPVEPGNIEVRASVALTVEIAP
jgi:uncharacterized protein YggE